LGTVFDSRKNQDSAKRPLMTYGVGQLLSGKEIRAKKEAETNTKFIQYSFITKISDIIII